MTPRPVVAGFTWLNRVKQFHRLAWLILKLWDALHLHVLYMYGITDLYMTH